MEVAPKYKTPGLTVGSSIEGIPIVEKYKYLGIWLDQFLSPLTHIEFLFGSQKKQDCKIKGKINNLTRCLSPCLKNISFDYRVNLWITFIRPLFLPLAAMAVIINETLKDRIQALLRASLRKFIGLPKNFSVDILAQAFPLDFKEWIRIESQNCRSKWTNRLKRERVPDDSLVKFQIHYRKSMPIEFAAFLKSFTAWCELCHKPFYPKHLEEHGLTRVRVEEVYEDIDNLLESVESVKGRGQTPKDRRKKVKIGRKERMELIAIHIQGKLKEIDAILKVHAKRNL